MSKGNRSAEQAPLLPKHNPAANDGEVSFRKTLAFCAPYIIPSTLPLKLLSLLSILSTILYKACLLIPGLAMKITVDALSHPDQLTRTRLSIEGTLAYFLGRLFAAGFSQGQDIALEFCQQHTSRKFARDSFLHLQSLSLSFHNKKRTGVIMSILGRGIGSIQKIMQLVFFSLMPTVLEALVVSSIFFRLGSPLIALFTVVTVVCYVLYTGYITKWRVRFGRQLREAQNKAWGRATESVMHYSTVKSFGMEREEVSRYDNMLSAVQGVAMKAKGIQSVYTIGQSFIVQFGTFLGLAIAALEASRGKISIGDFIMIQAYIGQLFGPLLWIGNSYGSVVQAITEVEQVMELFMTRQEVADMPGATDLMANDSNAGRSITFENVSFRYEGDENNSGVRSISFHVPPGGMVALVGPSGAGKSTIGKLLLRLYDIDEGRVLIDGTDVRSVTQSSLRHTIGLVAQETILFNDTLRNNITYGRPDATEMEIQEAVRMANLETFVTEQQDGLDIVVGEQGLRLSGGERQRVGIARALIKRPGIMMLDESTSALSTIDEQKIQKNLEQVCKGRTTVAIAHRLSTIMMADEILVLKEGEVVERGTHEHLIAANGFYAKMWRAQTGIVENNDKLISDVLSANVSAK